jgi:hypothetical protein
MSTLLIHIVETRIQAQGGLDEPRPQTLLDARLVLD